MIIVCLDYNSIRFLKNPTCSLLHQDGQQIYVVASGFLKYRSCHNVDRYQFLLNVCACVGPRAPESGKILDSDCIGTFPLGPHGVLCDSAELVLSGTPI